MTTREVDILNDSLDGMRLIEASAGTGKTYAIANYYLRLILEKKLHPEKILVVTFTIAATQELRERIRRKLRRALAILRNGTGPDPESIEIQAILQRFGDDDPAVPLETALRDFDEAAIHTIHGFCQRALNEFAFESGARFDVELVATQKELIDEVVNEFWRKYFPAAPRPLILYAANNGINRDSLRAFVDKSKAIANPYVPIEPELIPRSEKQIADLYGNILVAHRQYTEAFAALREIRSSERGIAVDWIEREKIYRKTKENIKESLERFLSIGPDDFMQFFDFRIDRFSRSIIDEAALGKKKTAPPNVLFDKCEALKTCAESLRGFSFDHFARLRAELVMHVRTRLPQLKELRNTQYFDDLVLTLCDALDERKNGDRAALLANALRDKYHAALIDEFQDTDAAQYDIFRKVFGEAGALFLIGDPKQAIYGFRGADVFTYMQAKQDAGDVLRLSRNHRSVPGLVLAVNRLFTGDAVVRNESGDACPFLYNLIPFEPSLGCNENELSALQMDQSAVAPMRVMQIHYDPAKPSVGGARKCAAETVATEILRLLKAAQSGDASIYGVPLRPADIAVLVRTHKHATITKSALGSLGIPSVLLLQESVFETHEAGELLTVLRAVAAPASEKRVRTSLSTDIFGIDAPALRALADDPERWETCVDFFHSLHRLWIDSGFSAMFRRLLFDEQAPRRLIRFTDGERIITNLLHLAELLNREESDRGLAPAELIQWFDEQHSAETASAEEHQLRIERDEDAVRIATIHASKGLEYPVVFCPFLWDQKPRLPNPESESKKSEEMIDPFAYHDVDNRLRIHLGLPDPQNRNKHLTGARREELAENMRLLYVALTRAKSACYFTWGDMKYSESSPLVGLLHAPGELASGTDPYKLFNACFKSKSSSGDFDKDVAAIVDNETICLMPEPEQRTGLYVSTGDAAPQLDARVFPPDVTIDSSRFVTSFSHLSGDRVHTPVRDPEYPDRDASATPEASASSQPEGIFAFPRGVRSGVMLHSLLENLDFASDEHTRAELVELKLREFGFEPRWRDTLLDMLRNLLGAPLLNGFTLSQLSSANRINELEFCHPLPRLEPAALAAAYSRFVPNIDFADFPQRIGRVRFDPVEGFMKGFIDMVFRHDGRYYLVDWKSNHLGDTLVNYAQPGLARAMASGMYVLQYHIYTVALDRFLRSRIPGYRYDKHFGGALYVFLRGVDSAAGPEYGVFRDLPPENLVRSLERTLCGADPRGKP